MENRESRPKFPSEKGAEERTDIQELCEKIDRGNASIERVVGSLEDLKEYLAE